MTDEERSIMQHHAAYWRGLMNKGKVLVFGPVLEPKGAYGFGIIPAENEEEVKAFMAGDPATKILTFEFYQMLAVVKE
jgi:uncharacterized protein YciI